MSMYKDSELGLCVDITGPDGNVFMLMWLGQSLARQLNQEAEWRGAVEAAKLMGGSYLTMVNLFASFFPIVTVVGLEQITETYTLADDIIMENNRD